MVRAWLLAYSRARMVVTSPDGEREFVYKICPRQTWLDALERGQLEPGADDVRDGFIHLSARDQVPGTLERHFHGQQDLVLLCIDSARLSAPSLRWEPSRGGRDFPHLYAPLPVTSVSQVTKVTWDGERHELPEHY